MTWPSAICFRVVAGALWGASVLAAANVTGTVEITGEHGSKHPNGSGVVVWLQEEGNREPPAPIRARMVQKNKTFTPHVLAIPMGSTVDFPNFDPIFHNAFSNYNGQIFDVGLYPPGKSRPVVFRQPGTVRVFCNIHPTMSAVIVVLPTPLYAITGPNGHFTLTGVPAGKYRMSVFDERATTEALAALGRAVEVGTEDLALEPLRISEAGYIPLPHANKFGRAYPREGDTYSAVP